MGYYVEGISINIHSIEMEGVKQEREYGSQYECGVIEPELLVFETIGSLRGLSGRETFL